MTLLVASTKDQIGWMISDAAITGGNIPLRNPDYQPKVESAPGKSLIGYAGDSYYGTKFIREASLLCPGQEVLRHLAKCQKDAPSVAFAYMYWEKLCPRLFRVDERGVEETSTLHIGNGGAFEELQRLRHDNNIEHAPNALHQIIVFEKSIHIPEEMRRDIRAMLTLISGGYQPDVGGWVIPYVLSGAGCELCSYGYSVTDPIRNALPLGSIIPHGTAERGGFGLSFAPLRDEDGMVVYWLQRHGGLVLTRSESGYEKHVFLGTPSLFKQRVSEMLGRSVDVCFSEQHPGPVNSLHFLRDERRQPRLAMAHHAEALSFSWLMRTEEPFQARLHFDRQIVGSKRWDEKMIHAEIAIDYEGVNICVCDDEGSKTIHTLKSGQIEDFIAHLARLRALLKEQVPVELPKGNPLLGMIDPAWRTFPPPHPSFCGPILHLRHPGFGWLTFIIPDREALNLGNWLIRNARETEIRAPGHDSD